MVKKLKYIRNVQQPEEFDSNEKWLTINEIKLLPEYQQIKEYKKWAPDRRNKVYLEQTEYAKEHNIQEIVYLSDDELADYLKPIEVFEKLLEREKRCLVSSDRYGVKRCKDKDCSTCVYFINWKNQPIRASSSIFYRNVEEDSELLEIGISDENTLSPEDAYLEKELIKVKCTYEEALKPFDKRLLELYRNNTNRKLMEKELGVSQRYIQMRIKELKKDFLAFYKKNH